jgi:hypothetical protein
VTDIEGQAILPAFHPPFHPEGELLGTDRKELRLPLNRRAFKVSKQRTGNFQKPLRKPGNIDRPQRFSTKRHEGRL